MRLALPGGHRPADGGRRCGGARGQGAGKRGARCGWCPLAKRLCLLCAAIFMPVVRACRGTVASRDDRVFVSRRRGRPLSGSDVRRRLERHLAAIDAPMGVSPHTSAIRSPPTCWRVGRIFVLSRNCWGMPLLPPLRCTRMCRLLILRAVYRRAHPRAWSWRWVKSRLIMMSRLSGGVTRSRATGRLGMS